MDGDDAPRRLEAAVDREKALDNALAQIEKQFGKGSVMKMGDDVAQKVAAIPTGALSLDLALGIGGLPRGRVVEIYGPESSGKCVVAGTYVWTDHGLETVEELFSRLGQAATVETRVTDVSAFGVRLVNEESKLEGLGGVTHNGMQDVHRVTLDSGRHVEATANHPLRVLNERGRIVWRTVAELQAGDVLVSALFGAETAVGGDHLSEDEAVLLGYLIAEGTLGESNRNSFAFANSYDEDVVDEYMGLLETVLGVPGHAVRQNNHNYWVHDAELRESLRLDYGLERVKSAGKEIPYRVRTAGAKVQRAFLSALYEGDGWIEQGPEVGLTTASRTLAEQVQLLLYGLGIPASLRTRHHDELDRGYHTVLVPPGAVHRFLEQVGFRSERRAAQVAKHLRDSAANTQLEHIPHLRDLLFDLRDALGGDRDLDALIGDLRRGDLTSRADGRIDCSPTRLLRVLDWIESQHVPASARPLVTQLHELAARPLTFERITSIEAVGEVPTFDVVVPGTHSFLANGVLSHNTTVALHAVAEAQKAGGIAAFIDAEHALDPTYARALGVDINELLVSQPDTGEQALEITDMLVRSGSVDIIVVDSVAALTPRAEIEGEMGDSHVGLQARLMSQALRKLAGSLNKSKTTAVFINQLREKIGVMFGSPETTSGGRALKFYSSVRLDVRRIESLKDGTDVVGNRVRVKVVKNKCLAEGSLVFDPTTGRTHRIEEIVDHGEASHVWAADKNGRMHVRPIRSRLDQGEQEVIGLNLRDGTELWVTPDHRVMTEDGWVQAGELAVGDRVARPARAGGFGDTEPVSPAHARMLGYLIGDGYVGGKTPIAFINTEPSLHADASEIASSLGCRTSLRKDGLYASFAHRPGERNELLELVRWAGIWGHLAPEKRIPAPFFAEDVSHDVVANVLFGIWESDGWVSRERTGGIRVGFSTTSEQLAWQLHWLLLRWGIASHVDVQQPASRGGGLIAGRRVETKLPCWQVRVSGIDNVHRFTAAIPMWGPKGGKLTELLDDPALAKHRGSRTAYLSGAQTEPVLAHLERRGVTARTAAAIVGDIAGDPQGGMKQVLGSSRLRRDRVAKLAEGLDDAFLEEVLADELYYDRITAISGPERRRTFDLEVEELHNFVAEGVVVHNCAPPFRQAEFDIMYGEGISREGSLIDVGVEEAVIRKAGAWYTYEGEQLGQGRENARSFLKEHTDIAAEIEKKVKDKLGLSPLAADEADLDELDLDE
jgi:recombination protein RecA